MSISIRLLLISLLLASCNGSGGKGGSTGPSSNPQASGEGLAVEGRPEVTMTVTPVVSLKSDMSNIDEFERRLNSHLIRVNVMNVSFKRASIRCVNQENSEIKETEFFGTEGTLLLHLDESNLKPSEVTCTVSGEQDFNMTKTFKVRKNLIISGHRQSDFLGQKADLETLVLKNESNLYANENNLEIKARTLISQGGRLSTFLKDSRAPKDQNGLSGGLLQIKAAVAIGDLIVELRGQNGGYHTQVPEKVTAIPVTPDSSHGKCGDNESGSKCIGKKGPTGYKGEKGFTGYDGGDSGSLSFQTKNLDRLSLTIKYYPGEGGEGGEGGLGSNGGKGGIGSEVRYYNESRNDGGCPKCSMASIEVRNETIKYPNGVDGDPGPVGDSGDKGQDGFRIQSNILTLDNSEEIIVEDNWSNSKRGL